MNPSEDKENKDERLPKQLGDFAEGMVMYVLGRMRGMSVALIDHVGADIIASKAGKRYAISVKSRIFSTKTKETRSTSLSPSHIEKLKETAKTFGMEAAVAFVFVDEYDGTMKIRILLATTEDLEKGAGDKKYFLHKSSKSGELWIGYHNEETFKQMRECGFIDYIEFKLKEEEKGFRFPPVE